LPIASLIDPLHTDVILFIQTEDQMAKAAVARRAKGAATTARRVRGSRALGVETETEAIDQALDFVVFGEELAKGFTAVRRSGGVDDVLEGRRRT
jgi:hypothetical protein